MPLFHILPKEASLTQLHYQYIIVASYINSSSTVWFSCLIGWWGGHYVYISIHTGYLWSSPALKNLHQHSMSMFLWIFHCEYEGTLLGVAVLSASTSTLFPHNWSSYCSSQCFLMYFFVIYLSRLAFLRCKIILSSKGLLEFCGPTSPLFPHNWSSQLPIFILNVMYNVSSFICSSKLSTLKYESLLWRKTWSLVTVPQSHYYFHLSGHFVLFVWYLFIYLFTVCSLITIRCCVSFPREERLGQQERPSPIPLLLA